MKNYNYSIIFVFSLLVGYSCKQQKNPLLPSDSNSYDIVYHTNFQKIYRLNINNHNKQLLPVVGAHPLASPDGHHLAYYVFQDRVNGKSVVTLNLSEIDGQNEKQLVKIAEGDSVYIIYTASWSPDSKKIAYATPKEERSHKVFLYDIETNKEVRLSIAGGVDPSFSPDSRFVTYDVFAPDGIGHSFIVNTDGSGHRVFMPAQQAIGPQWSPDMQRIYYTLYRSSGPNIDADVFVVDADETNPVQMTFEGKSILIKLSPDGKYFLYRVIDTFDTQKIYVFDIENNNSELITDRIILFRAYWSPNGKMIAFPGFTGKSNSRVWLWRQSNNSIEELDIPGEGLISWIPSLAN